VQDTDFGKSDISDDFEGNPDDEYEENDREERNAITQQAYHHKQYQGKKDMKIQKTPDTLRSGMFLFL